MQSLPEKLFDFAWFPNRDEQLQKLADQAEAEDWNYQHTPSEYPLPILFNYIDYTYRRLAEEGKIKFSADRHSASFNTGLVTPDQEALCAYFECNPPEFRSPWLFKEWYAEGHWQLNDVGLPDIASYFDDPSVLVFDRRKEFRKNTAHILHDPGVRDRFPEEYRSMSDAALGNVLEGATLRARRRADRNYKTAIPQYYQGQVQLLLPLCLNDLQRADLALVLDVREGSYRAATCLTLDMAYNNARQLARPDRDWLQP